MREAEKLRLEKKEESEESEEGEGEETEGVRVEYKIDYLKQNGTHSSKVFMVKSKLLLEDGRSKPILMKGS